MERVGGRAALNASLMGEQLARINIDDEFFEDVALVAAKLGNVDLAHGQALRLIKFGQTLAKAGKVLSHEEFQRKGFSDHLFPEFATRVGDSVIIRGAAKHFAWLAKKAEAGAKGGRSKTEAKVSKLKQNRSKPKQTEAKVSTTEASFSSSSSFSSSDSSTSSISNTTYSTPKGSAFVAAYCDRFKFRWNESPQITGKDAGIAKRLAKNMSQERFEFLLDAFFEMPDAWLVKNKHPLNLFETKLNEVVVFAGQGKFTTAKEARHADDSVSTHQMLKDIAEGKL